MHATFSRQQQYYYDQLQSSRRQYWLRQPQHFDRRNKDEDVENRACVGNVEKIHQQLFAIMLDIGCTWGDKILTASSIFYEKNATNKLNSRSAILVALLNKERDCCTPKRGISESSSHQTISMYEFRNSTLSPVKKLRLMFFLEKKKSTSITITERPQTSSITPSFTSTRDSKDLDVTLVQDIIPNKEMLRTG